MASILIRAASEADIDGVLHIQQQCYTAVEPESRESMLAKITASPATCLVAHTAHASTLCAYFLAIPWQSEQPPQLNQTVMAVPTDADCLYLHDLAVAPAARNTGAGKALVEAMLALFRHSPYDTACLIAIQNAAPYWQRFGFQPVHALPEGLQAKLRTYGATAQYMQLRKTMIHAEQPSTTDKLCT